MPKNYKKAKVKKVEKALTKGDFVERHPIYRRPKTAKQSFEATHSTAAKRKKSADVDRSRIEKVLGKDWRQQVFGDVKRYRSQAGTVRGTQKKIKKLKGREATLKSQVGTPGASDELIQRRISRLQQREGQVQRGGGKAYAKGSFQRNKQRFQSAAEKATETLAQQKSKKTAANLKKQMGGLRVVDLTRNPNAPVNVQKRKKKAKANLTKQQSKVATYRSANTGPGSTGY